MKLIIVTVLSVILFLGLTPNNGYGQVQKKIIKIEKKGKQGYLGVEIQDVTRKLKEKKNLSVDKGAYVQDVSEDSPAEKAGIEKGDVIVKIGDETVDNGEELTDAVRAIKPKTEVKIEINRKGEKKTMTAIVGKLKTPQVFSYNFNDDGFRSMVKPPTAPNMMKKFNLRIATENEINGLQTQSLTKQLGEYFGTPNGKGVLVAEVEKGSAAAKAGFKAGDVIIKVDNQSIDDVDEMNEELSELGGKEIPFDVIRNGKPVVIKMKIEKEEEDEDEEDSSSNIFFHPNHQSLGTLRMNLPERIDLQVLRENLKELKENIHRNIRHIKQNIKNELIKS